MGEFFLSWALWEKLVFCLACAIVLTMFLGLGKLYYNYRKLRRYTAVAEKEGKEKALQRQMSQRSTRRRSQDIPFGIRAIQSGIEVEGVWISRSNTPEPTSAKASMITLTLPESSSQTDYFNIDIEKLAASSNQRSRDTSDNTLDNPRYSRPTFDHAVSAEIPSSSNNTSRDHSPECPITKPAKSRHPPSTFTRYSSNPYILRHDSSLSALEGINAIYRTSGHMRPRRSGSDPGDDSVVSSGESSNDSGLSESISASAPHLLNSQPRTRTHSLDLELMQSHRLSQAAETGQLTPRARRPATSGDWTGASRDPSQNSLASMYNKTASTGSSKPVEVRHPSTTTERAVESRDGSSDDEAPRSKIFRLPTHVRRSSMPDVTPFHAFCQSVPPSPRSESSDHPTPSPTTPHTPAPLSLPLPSSTSAPIIRPPEFPSASSPPSSSSGSTPVRRPAFEKRKSDILRGHGSGFEILVPGTLKPVEHPLERQRAVPPLSLRRFDSAANGGGGELETNGMLRPRSSSSDSSRRKLQKRRRPSEDSRRSVESGGRGSRASVE